MPDIIPFSRFLLNQAPYTMWRERGPDGLLPHDAVVEGFGLWLTRDYARMWRLQTDLKARWYLQRRDSLKAWCLDEARDRLGSGYREFWSAEDFHSFHFNEAVQDFKRQALRDPFWTRLFVNRQLAGDDKFFARIPLLLAQQPYQFQTAKRLYAILFDRLAIPLAWWSFEAAAMYLEECLARIDRQALAPSGELLRQWTDRLGLKQERPVVITKWRRGVGVPPDGFDEEAYLCSPIPKPYKKTSIHTENGC
jgi:hypothetical protein